MARILPILDEKERREFDTPPSFSPQQRKFFFSLPDWALQILKELTYDYNRLGFVLQVGYFKATGRFFKPSLYHKADKLYVRQRFRLAEDGLVSYDWAILTRHRIWILSHFGVRSFKGIDQEELTRQTAAFAKRQMNPALVFRSLAEYIRTHRIELPTYAALALVVTEGFRQVEEENQMLLNRHLTEAMLEKLDTLLVVDSSQQALPNKPYRITLLKKSFEVMRPAAIRSNIADYLLLKEMYILLRPLLEQLRLSDEMIHYYARLVIRLQVFQLLKQEHRKYLMLICFIVYQYYRLGDLLIETLLSAVRTTRNATGREEKEQVFRQHQGQSQTMQQVMEGVLTHIRDLEALEDSTFSFAKTHEEKVKDLAAWINSESIKAFKSLKPKAELLCKPDHKDYTYYKVLEDKSRSLQSRIADIIRHVDFEFATEHPLGEAIAHFRQKKGILAGSPPAGFLKKTEAQALEKATSRVSLYKALLALHLADYIKGGKANVSTTFRHKPFVSYLIEEQSWHRNKQKLLENALLDKLSDCDQVLAGLRLQLEQSFQHTFGRMNAGGNTLVEKRKDGKPRFITPAEEARIEVPVELYPLDHIIPIYEVLNTVNAHCHFTDCLQHWNVRYRQARPGDAVFFAGIMSYGCNLGLGKLANTSKNLSLNTLESTVNWYFALENLQKANNAIVSLMGKLRIGELFRQDEKLIHSSSDGQKHYMQVDSIHANYSYKYFGKEKGITIYSFIDEMHRLFYSTSFSSSEREASYVIDGLMHHPDLQPDLHSTDTHGYSEAIFALTHLLGIGFAPRIKGFQDGNLYPMEGMEVPALNEYSLKIGAPVNTQIIKENWDTLLRVVASIKLKHVSASSLLRRLNSYSRQHPVYLALKELGKLVRTEFLLRYMDQEGLRKRIDNQLQKIESAHHFSRAVFYGNNGEIRFAGKEEQLLADACKRLIQNSIICWNYLYLTQLLMKTTAAERPQLIETIKHSSPVSWQHINLQGEFDFSEESLQNAITFNLTELMELELTS